MAKEITISDNVYNALAQLSIGFDTPSDVIARLLKERSKAVGSQKASTISINDDIHTLHTSSAVSQKVLRRASGWAGKRPRPNIGNLINVYLELAPDNQGVTEHNFIKAVQAKNIYDGNEFKIINNLNAMKSDRSNTHGLIFRKEYDKLYICNEATFQHLQRCFAANA